MIQNQVPKSSCKYTCEKCDYYTNRKSQYTRHLQTKKHNDTNDTLNDTKKVPNYKCRCGKAYKYHTGLSRHKKTCNYTPSSQTEESILCENGSDFKDMFIHLLQSNKELQDMIIQQQENTKELQTQLLEYASQPKTIIKNQQNNFNLKNFLNIQCKDAMNLSDFLETIQLSFNDLLYMGDSGFVKSLQDTFVKQLGDLDQEKRPIHCTDKKRKTMYVKEENKWEKDEGHKKIANAIDTMNKKQFVAFNKHAKNRPKDYLDDDKNLDTQHKIFLQMCGYKKDTYEEWNKKVIGTMVDATEIKK